jgi:adenine phosphoribosyltransferase
MDKMKMEKIKKDIRIVEGFPKEGISFKDITTLLKDGEDFRFTVDQIIEDLKDQDIDLVVGPESRGFIMGLLSPTDSGSGLHLYAKQGNFLPRP